MSKRLVRSLKLLFLLTVLIPTVFAQFQRTNYAYHGAQGFYDTIDSRKLDWGNPLCKAETTSQTTQSGIGFESQEETKWGNNQIYYTLFGLKNASEIKEGKSSDFCIVCDNCCQNSLEGAVSTFASTTMHFSSLIGGMKIKSDTYQNPPGSCTTESQMHITNYDYDYGFEFNPGGEDNWNIFANESVTVPKCRVDAFNPSQICFRTNYNNLNCINTAGHGGCITDAKGKICQYEYSFDNAVVDHFVSVMGGYAENQGCRSGLQDGYDEFQFCTWNSHIESDDHLSFIEDKESGSSNETHFSETSCDDSDPCTADYCGETGNCIHDPIPGCQPGYHSRCSGNQCVTIQGAGQNECRGNQDCKITNYHNECSAQKKCVSVPGAGVSTCFSDSYCQKTHKACVQNGSCTSVMGEGTDECQTNDECVPHHTECNGFDACVDVPGNGSNECQTSGDCLKQFRSDCQGYNCISVEGPGADQCSSNADCQPTHLACQNKSCIEVPGEGTSECLSDADCKKDYHLACNGRSCSSVEGPGTDACQTYWDCQSSSHYECRNNACVSVSGPGSNTCQSDADCIPFHQECSKKGPYCISVPGLGENTCYNDSECVEPTHLGCNANKQCVSKDGPGIDECNVDAECSQNDFHLACINKSCVPVPGGGMNLCDSNQDCVHSECQGYVCVEVLGPPQPGDILCSTDFECNWHLACDETKDCVPRFGPPQPGEQLCTRDADCQLNPSCKITVLQDPINRGETTGVRLDVNNFATLPLTVRDVNCGDSTIPRMARLTPTGEQTQYSKVFSGTCGPYPNSSPPGQPFQVGYQYSVNFIDCSFDTITVNGPAQTRKACSGTNCIEDACEPPNCTNECETDNDCSESQHLECRGADCGWVDNSPGNTTNQCFPEGVGNPTCQQQTNPHNECQGATCVQVDTMGINECNNPGQQDPLCGMPSSLPPKLYIDRVEVNPASSSQGTSVESIIVIIKNVSKDACQDGMVSLAFANEKGESLARVGAPLHQNLLFNPGETKETFNGYPGTDFDTRSLGIGIYSVQAALNCGEPSDRKKMFFTVQEANYSQIPETNWSMVLLVLVVALVFLWPKNK